MRTWIVVGLAAVLGIGTGVGIAFLRVESWPWDGSPEGVRASRPDRPPPQPNLPQPKAYLPEDTHDFGVMHSNAKGRYEFVVFNRGEAPLAVKMGSSSCKCTVAIPEDAEVPPGGSTKVALEWTGKEEGLSTQFSQHATILTNDPESERITLTIKGRMLIAVQALPPELTFSRITAGESQSAQVRLFGFRPEFRQNPLAVTGYELLEPDGRDHFEVTFKPLGPDQLKAEEDATSGLVAEVTVKPGLPVGAFHQRILLKTTSPEVPTLEIPVRGRIGSEITVFGRGWNEKLGVLTLGRVASRDGGQWTVLLRAGGPHYKEVDFELVEKVPELLDIVVGQPTESPDRQAIATPLTIRIPKGSPPADHLVGEKRYGRLRFKTNHPTAPELLVLLRFVIEG